MTDRLRLLAFGLVAALATGCGGGGPAAVPPTSTPSGVSSGKAVTLGAKHVFPSRKDASQHPRATASGSGNLLYHGGPIQKTPAVYLIFWGFSGANDAAHDPRGMATYLTHFFLAVGGSTWIASDTQYTSGSQGAIANPSAQLAGVWYDASQPPASYAQADVANEALRGVSHFGYNADGNYMVVTPTGVTTSGFGTQFCAYHSSVTSGSQVVAYTDLPYVPDAGTSCGQGSVNSPGTLDGVSIVAGHEEGETQTDPQPNSGWIDSANYENGDKCAWTGLANTAFEGGTFPTQPLWSNATSSCTQSYGSPQPRFTVVGHNVFQASGGPFNTAWALGPYIPDANGPAADRGVHYWNGLAWDDTQANNGIGATWISTAADDGSPWIVNSWQSVYHYYNGTWQNAAGLAASRVAAAPGGHAWALSATRQTSGTYPGYALYYWNGNVWDSTQADNNVGATDLSVAADGSVWISTSAGTHFHLVNGVWQTNPTFASEPTAQIAGALSTAWALGAFIPDGHGTSADRGVHFWNGNGWDDSLASSGVGGTQISVSADGPMWLVNSWNDLNVYR